MGIGMVWYGMEGLRLRLRFNKQSNNSQASISGTHKLMFDRPAG